MMNEAATAQSPSKGAALIDKLRKGTQNEAEVFYPGTDERIVLVPLRCDELQVAYSEAYQRFRSLKMEVNAYNADDFWSEVNLQVIAKAMRDPADPTRRRTFFKDANEARECMLPDERSTLTSAYVALNDSANPDPDAMDAKVFEEISEYVKKKDVIRLSAFASSTLAAYLIGTDNPQAS